MCKILDSKTVFHSLFGSFNLNIRSKQRAYTSLLVIVLLLLRNAKTINPIYQLLANHVPIVETVCIVKVCLQTIDL